MLPGFGGQIGCQPIDGSDRAGTGGAPIARRKRRISRRVMRAVFTAIRADEQAYAATLDHQRAAIHRQQTPRAADPSDALNPIRRRIRSV